MMIDSHIHLWRAGDGYDVWIRRKIAGIDRDFTPQDFRAAAPAGIAAAVLVHATEDPLETPHLLRLAAEESLVAAVIGWADLGEASLPSRLDSFMAWDKFRGLRVMPAFGGDPEWLLRPLVLGNLRELARRGLVLDLLAAPAQLMLIPRVKEAVPDLPIMLNHCGRPLTATGEVEPWAGTLRRVARTTDILCKLSSLAERAGMDWTTDRLQPYLDAVLDAFGPGRLAFGSNWPVVNIAASYAGWWEALHAMLARHALSPDDRDAVFGGTAARFYQLGR